MLRTATSSCLAILTALAALSCKDTSAPTTKPIPEPPASATTTASKESKPADANAAQHANAGHATPGPISPPAVDATTPANYPGLHNVVTYHAGLYSGAAPEGDDGFESLQELGVRTIISVDGTEPDVEDAKAHGIRYVHLPVGYDGVSAERTLEIARAIHDLPGPVYLHCHHGKHRSASALGAAAVTLGYLTPEQATARMKVSGTAENYKGLYKCVADATPADAAKLNTASNAFPSVSKTSGFTQTMVVVDEHFDSIKAVEKAKWTVPSDHPDLVPTAVAGELHNLFRGLESDPDVKARPEDFKQWLRDSATQAQTLEAELAKPTPSGEVLAAQFKLMSQTCKQCHAKYRD
jgi:protein tyrosine phosphatase (PTP) superfamily phosphohydrolase (DUF442 family)